MIVACPSCSARFKVADEKIGPQGAKLRCSKCQKIFTVQRDVRAAAPPAITPPPGRRGAALDLDLEPPGPPAPSPFGALPQPDDPFAPGQQARAAAAPPAFADPPPPADDPFAAYHRPPAGGAPPPLPRPSEPPPPPPPYPSGLTADLLALPARTPAPAARPPLADGLALEEPTVRPSRSTLLQARPTLSPPPAPGPVDGWLGELGGGELEGRPGDVPSFPDVIPDTAVGFDTGSFSQPFPAPAAPVTGERPAQRTAGEEVTARRRAAAGSSTTGQPGGPGRGTRLRVALVDTFALAVLLLAALALAAFWRGGLTPAEALQPRNLLAAFLQRPAAGPLETSEVQGGFYERRRGAPLLFVRGRVTSRAPGPVGPVRVSVDVVRDGQVLAHLEGRAGGPLGPEALAEVEDAPGLARLAEAAAAAAPATIAPGQAVPFLVALADPPPGLDGAAVRVSAEVEGQR